MTASEIGKNIYKPIKPKPSVSGWEPTWKPKQISSKYLEWFGTMHELASRQTSITCQRYLVLFGRQQQRARKEEKSLPSANIAEV